MSKSMSFDTVKRVASAAIGLPLYAWGIITNSFHNFPLLFVTLVISLVTLHEFYRMTDKGSKGKAFYAAGMILGGIIAVSFYLCAAPHGFSMKGWDFINLATVFPALLTLIMVFILVLQLMTRPIQHGIYSMSVTMAGLLIIVIPFAHIIPMKALENGAYHIFLLNFVVMINDTGGYFGGLMFGKHKTNFEVSPKKSWEGYASGLILSVLGVIGINAVFARFFSVTLFTFPESVVVGLMLSLLATLGDLTESLIKRDSGVKDSGTIIPGHGGMWDTFDAVIFSYPVYYYYLLVKGFV